MIASQDHTAYMRDDQSYESNDSDECHTDRCQHRCHYQHDRVEPLDVQPHLLGVIVAQEDEIQFLGPEQERQ